MKSDIRPRNQTNTQASKPNKRKTEADKNVTCCFIKVYTHGIKGCLV